jgi:hypothetical protein
MGTTLHFRESIESELSASGVDRFVKMYDYSDQEWDEIELSAQPARAGPLTEDVRQHLRRAGNVYLTLHSAGREFLKQQELTSVENWENIRGLAAELYELLDEPNVRNTDDRKYRRLQKSIANLRDEASIFSAKSPLLPPREDYYREILGIWVDKLGGELGVSRDTVTHKLGGPLVRFFQAVTCPVLATEAPALETISHIVSREKKRRRECRKNAGQVPARMAAYVEQPTRQAVGYSDLGPFRTDPNISFDRQVHDYVVERGRTTGVQHMIAADAEGTVIAHASGGRAGFIFPGKFGAALYDYANKITIHINDPSSTGLTECNVACLAFPGVEAICRHGNSDNFARGALTPKARAMLRRDTPEEACRRLGRIACGIGFRLYEVLTSAVDSGKISAVQADRVHHHVVGLCLRDAGILDYRLEKVRARRRPA